MQSVWPCHITWNLVNESVKSSWCVKYLYEILTPSRQSYACFLHQQLSRRCDATFAFPDFLLANSRRLRHWTCVLERNRILLYFILGFLYWCSLRIDAFSCVYDVWSESCTAYFHILWMKYLTTWEGFNQVLERMMQPNLHYSACCEYVLSTRLYMVRFHFKKSRRFCNRQHFMFRILP